MIELLGYVALVQVVGLVGMGLLAIRDRIRGRRVSDMLGEALFTLFVLTFWPVIVPLALVVRALTRLGLFASPRVSTSEAEDRGRIQRGRFGFYVGWLEDWEWNARWVAVGVPDRRWLGVTVGLSDRYRRR